MMSTQKGCGGGLVHYVGALGGWRFVGIVIETSKP